MANQKKMRGVDDPKICCMDDCDTNNAIYLT